MTNILTNLPVNQALKYKDGHTALKYVPYGKTDVVDISWDEFADFVKCAASSLIDLNVERQGMIAVFSPNRPESIVVDFAAYAVRAVPVSIYATSSADQVKYILNDSNATIVFVGDAHQFFTVAEIAGDCPSLKHIVVYDPGADVPSRVGGCDVHRWRDFLEMADDEVSKQVAKRTSEATPNDVATLIYTSGTTGEPKGAVLTHHSFDAVMKIHRQRLDYLTDADRSLSFLPLCHIFEKAWTYFCMYMGMTVTVNENPRAVSEALLRERPTCMCAVPRFWEKAYAAIHDKIENAPWHKRMIFRRAIEIGRRRNLHYLRLGLKVPGWLEQRYRFYDRIVLSPARRAMGVDKGRLFPTAGAPLSADITEFFIAAGVPLIIGYGLSETTATVTCYPTTGYVVGSVGTRMPEVEVRIGKDSEIQVKGPTVMSGYHNKPTETAAAFTDDGWFRTGDAGYFDSEGALVITDRLKDLFKTSNGKYIAPQAIESKLGEDRFIDQVAVIGDRRKYVTALIIPAFKALKEYARKRGIAFKNMDELVNNGEIRRMIERRIDRLQSGLPSFERIKRFVMLPHEFSIEHGELTNTLKLRRRVINRLYADEIEGMYI